MLEIPNLKGKDLFKFLIDNEKTLVAQKKFDLKRADAVYFSGSVENQKGIATKANGIAANKTELAVTSIINTTYWYDSHGDVHIDGLWKKSLSENKEIYLLQEHKMEFDKIIAYPEDVKAYTKTISWRSLGVDFDGYTEALVFDSTVKLNQNDYMFDRYKEGKVRNHSVGMRYVSIDLAVNDEDYPAHKALWDKYISKIANQAEVQEAGYYWPVMQAKVVEGSAVPMGSNRITPTQSVKDIAPPEGTQTRAADSTRAKALNNLLKVLKA
jgi:hypothetical protein